MTKQGQITIFLVVGIIALMSIGLVYFIITQESTSTLENKNTHLDSDFIVSFVDNCLSQSAHDAIIKVALQGGYNTVPEVRFLVGRTYVPYYLINEKLIIPSKEQIEIEVEQATKEFMQGCIDDFSVFRKMGYEIEDSDMKLTVLLGKVSEFDLDYPITIRQGEDTTKLTTFVHIKQLNFERIYEFISKIGEEQQKTLNMIPIGFISQVSMEQNVPFRIYYLSQDTTLLTFSFEDFSDRKTLVPLQFRFIHKYNWDFLKQKTTIDIPLPNITCYVGDRCHYNLNLYSEELEFRDLSDLIDITTEGILDFIPTKDMIGKHDIVLEIMNSEGNKESETLKLEVKQLGIPIHLEDISAQKAIIGKPFSYQIETEEEHEQPLQYISDSLFVPISDQGKIEFTPIIEQRGTHLIKITAYDTYWEDSTWLLLTIE